MKGELKVDLGEFFVVVPPENLMKGELKD